MKAVRDTDSQVSSPYNPIANMVMVDNPYSPLIEYGLKGEKRKLAMASTMTEEEVGRIHGSRSTVNFGRVEFLEIVHVSGRE